MKKRLYLIVLSLAAVVMFSACSSKQNENIGMQTQTTSIKWRCAVISCGDSLATQYKYDVNGKIAEIIEYQNEGLNPGDKQSVSYNRIAFDEKGSISLVTTSVDGMTTEIIDAHTWRIYSDSYSLTVSYNDLFLCETQIMDLVDTVKITTKTNYDAKGKAISAITEYEYYGESQKYQSTTNYEYEYDCNGNPVIQYSLTEDGKHITATYSWEH